MVFLSGPDRQDIMRSMLGKDCRCERCVYTNIQDEIKVLEYMLNKPGKSILKAIEQIDQKQNYKRFGVDINCVLHLGHVYENHFGDTHALAYELYCVYSVRLWQMGYYREAVMFLDKLLKSISKWKKHDFMGDMMRLSSWSVIFRCLILVFEEIEKKQNKYICDRVP